MVLMRAHVTTYRHATSREAQEDITRALTTDTGPIYDQTARAIASWYQSPGDADRAVTALSSGLPFDTERLREESLRMSARDCDVMCQWIDNLEELMTS